MRFIDFFNGYQATDRSFKAMYKGLADLVDNLKYGILDVGDNKIVWGMDVELVGADLNVNAGVGIKVMDDASEFNEANGFDAYQFIPNKVVHTLDTGGMTIGSTNYVEVLVAYSKNVVYSEDHSLVLSFEVNTTGAGFALASFGWDGTTVSDVQDLRDIVELKWEDYRNDVNNLQTQITINESDIDDLEQDFEDALGRIFIVTASNSIGDINNAIISGNYDTIRFIEDYIFNSAHTINLVGISDMEISAVLGVSITGFLNTQMFNLNSSNNIQFKNIDFTGSFTNGALIEIDGSSNIYFERCDFRPIEIFGGDLSFTLGHPFLTYESRAFDFKGGTDGVFFINCGFEKGIMTDITATGYDNIHFWHCDKLDDAMSMYLTAPAGIYVHNDRIGMWIPYNYPLNYSDNFEGMAGAVYTGALPETNVPSWFTYYKGITKQFEDVYVNTTHYRDCRLQPTAQDLDFTPFFMYEIFVAATTIVNLNMFTYLPVGFTGIRFYQMNWRKDTDNDIRVENYSVTGTEVEFYLDRATGVLKMDNQLAQDVWCRGMFYIY